MWWIIVYYFYTLVCTSISFIFYYFFVFFIYYFFVSFICNSGCDMLCLQVSRTLKISSRKYALWRRRLWQS